jgi:electron transfer flavoprotein beta subunit
MKEKGLTYKATGVEFGMDDNYALGYLIGTVGADSANPGVDCPNYIADYNVRVRVRPDGSGVETDGVKMSINPFDEIALEEALRIKEQGKADEIIVVSIGTNEAQQQLRTALAMGADKAILIETGSNLDPLSITKIFQYIISQENPNLVILGKQAIDNDNNQTGQMLAALLDWPQATFASKIALSDTSAIVTREVDAGLESIEISLPAIITADLRLNEPRYVKLPDIMKAKKKPLEIIAFEDLNIKPNDAIKIINTESPEQRQKGIMVDNVPALLKELEKKGLI